MAGIVYVDGQKEDKAGSMFEETAKIEVRGSTLKYVSRGGLKLEKAMTHFGVTLDQKDLHGCGSVHRRVHRLHAAERGGEGLFCGCGPWTAGLEAQERPAGGLHGKDQYPLCDPGGDPGSRSSLSPLTYPLSP